MAIKSRNDRRLKKHLKIRSKISGTSEIPRLCVFKSLANFEAQLIDDTAGKTIAYSSTIALDLKQGGNIAAAQQVGAAMGKKIKGLNIEKIVFDRSGYIYHGRVQAFADAVRKEGVKF